MAEESDELEIDPSAKFDMVTLFSSSNHDAEMEANSIHGLLESEGIPSMVVGSAQLPVLEFQVQVPQVHLEEAERVLAEAKAAGPSAAVEAERASEEKGS